MDSGFRSTLEHDRNERAVRSLCERTGAPHGDVRALLADESARLALRGTVRSYVPLLAAANVYAALRRRVKPPRSELPAAAQILRPTTANDPSS